MQLPDRVTRATIADSTPRDPAARPLYSTASFRLTLIAICLAAAAPRLYFAVTQFIEYDGYWNAFIAQQDRWRSFIWEYQTIAHPPLYYLLLRVSLWFGHSPLIYRAVSLITGIATIWLLATIAAKVMRWRFTPLLV